MTVEEELSQLRQENSLLREQVGLQQATMTLQGELIQRQQEQIRLQEQQLMLLTEQVKVLQERLAKDSHNSHLPPSSDRFVRQPKSLRKKSGKKPGGAPGHPGKTLLFSSAPDEVIVHPLKRCPHCQEDLQTQPCCGLERRQVVEVPEPRLVVVEHQAERKHCPACQQLGTAAFPELVRAYPLWDRSCRPSSPRQSLDPECTSTCCASSSVGAETGAASATPSLPPSPSLTTCHRLNSARAEMRPPDYQLHTLLDVTDEAIRRMQHVCTLLAS